MNPFVSHYWLINYDNSYSSIQKNGHLCRYLAHRNQLSMEVDTLDLNRLGTPIITLQAGTLPAETALSAHLALGPEPPTSDHPSWRGEKEEG